MGKEKVKGMPRILKGRAPGKDKANLKVKDKKVNKFEACELDVSFCVDCKLSVFKHNLFLNAYKRVHFN